MIRWNNYPKKNRIMEEVKFIKVNGIFFREPRHSDLDLNWYEWLNDQICIIKIFNHNC